MPTPTVPRLLLALLPTLVIASIVASAIWGQNGLYTRYQLERDLGENHARLSELERDNQRMLRQLKLMDEDPIILERMVAEELAWGRPGAVIYRFQD